MQEGRLRAMCLWSPAEPRLLNQSAGCDRLTGREKQRVVYARLCVCARTRGVPVCASSLGENKRCEIETKRQIDRLMRTQKNTAVSDMEKQTRRKRRRERERAVVHPENGKAGGGRAKLSVA